LFHRGAFNSRFGTQVCAGSACGSNVLPASNRPTAACNAAIVWLSYRSVVVIDACPRRSRTCASGTPLDQPGGVLVSQIVPVEA
jgi:hypothetical protein